MSFVQFEPESPYGYSLIRKTTVSKTEDIGAIPILHAKKEMITWSVNIHLMNYGTYT